MMKTLLSLSFLLILNGIIAQKNQLAQLKYKGGGDYYANPTSLKNLIGFCNSKLGTNLDEEYEYLEATDPQLFTTPFVHITGHGNILFTEEERESLRNYLLSGGFIHIDDNYGMDKFVRTEIAKIFPDKELKIVPSSHPIYQSPFELKQLPKIHEHDNKSPEGLGIFHEGELILFYSYESDLSDGWEDPNIHQDPEDIRLLALKMGANLINYAFTRQLPKP